jgi:hypothetical protein
LCVAVSFLQVAIGWWREGAPKWWSLLKDGLMTFLLAYTFIITIPTQADRSFSLKMLQHIAEAPSGLSRDEIGHFYTDDFVRRGGLDRRLEEQQATGTLIERNGKFTLTSRGKAVDDMTRFTCLVFLCQAQPYRQ